MTQRFTVGATLAQMAARTGALSQIAAQQAQAVTT